VRGAFPDVVIRSEVIVGFPGETQEEFDDLKRFLEEFTFDSLGVFPYSPEPGTEALQLDERIDSGLVRERAGEIAGLQEAVSFGARARFQNQTLRVLIDRALGDEDAGDGGAARVAGRFYGQAPEIDGEVFVTGGARVGEFVDVHVTETDVFDLYGEVAAGGGAKE